jgi:hypothetical protein
MSQTIELSEESIEAIAQRLAEVLGERARPAPPAERIDAAEVARRYGVSRAWVYEHAGQLGAERAGFGPRPRLRFDPARVADAIAAPATREECRRGTVTRAAQPPATRRPRRRPSTNGVELLPIRGGTH